MLWRGRMYIRHMVFSHYMEILSFFPDSHLPWVTSREQKKPGTASFMPKMDGEIHILVQRKPCRSPHTLLVFWLTHAFSFNSSHPAQLAQMWEGLQYNARNSPTRKNLLVLFWGQSSRGEKKVTNSCIICLLNKNYSFHLFKWLGHAWPIARHL